MDLAEHSPARPLGRSPGQLDHLRVQAEEEVGGGCSVTPRREGQHPVAARRLAKGQRLSPPGEEVGKQSKRLAKEETGHDRDGGFGQRCPCGGLATCVSWGGLAQRALELCVWVDGGGGWGLSEKLGCREISATLRWLLPSSL